MGTFGWIIFGLLAYVGGCAVAWSIAYRLGVKEGADMAYDLGYEDGEAGLLRTAEQEEDRAFTALTRDHPDR